MLITLLAIAMNALKKLLSRQDFVVSSVFPEGLLSGVEKSSFEPMLPRDRATQDIQHSCIITCMLQKVL